MFAWIFITFSYLFETEQGGRPEGLSGQTWHVYANSGLFKNTVKHNITQGFSNCVWCVQDRVRWPKFSKFRHRNELCFSVLCCIVLEILWPAFCCVRTIVFWLPEPVAYHTSISLPFWMDFGWIWVPFGSCGWGDTVRLGLLNSVLHPFSFWNAV